MSKREFLLPYFQRSLLAQLNACSNASLIRLPTPKDVRNLSQPLGGSAATESAYISRPAPGSAGSCAIKVGFVRKGKNELECISNI